MSNKKTGGKKKPPAKKKAPAKKASEKTKAATDEEKGVPDIRHFMPVHPELIRPYRPGAAPLVEVAARLNQVNKEVEHRLFGFGADADMIAAFVKIRNEYGEVLSRIINEHNARLEHGSEDPQTQKLIDAGKQMAIASVEAARKANAANGQGPAPGTDEAVEDPDDEEEDGEEGEGGRIIGRIDTRTQKPKTGGKAGTKKAAKKKPARSKPAVRGKRKK